jgi:hypothetical protein
LSAQIWIVVDNSDIDSAFGGADGSGHSSRTASDHQDIERFS